MAPTHLSLYAKSSTLQSPGQRYLVDRLQQTRPKIPMQLDRTVDKDRPDFIFRHLRAFVPP